MIKESEILELKKSVSETKEAIISIVAILNKHQRGAVTFGVKNNGEVIRQEIGKDTLRNLSKSIFDNIEPKIYPIIKEKIINKKRCIVVDFSGNEIPYYAYGRPYIRTADEDRLMSAKESEKMILERNKEQMRWDNKTNSKASIKDVSVNKLKIFLKTAGLKYINLKNSLDSLNLLYQNKPTNASLILFGKKPDKFFPNAKLRCATFADNDTIIPLDMKDFEGDLFYLIDQAEKYILRNIHIGMKLDGLRRIDVPEINKDAFREAIINAFCHRDYWKYDSVNIAVFKNRLEMRNPGGLYEGLTVNQIIKKNISKRRNELIADIFHRVHFMEKWGRGIKLILSKEPGTKFEEIAGLFIIIFKRKNYRLDVSKTVGKGVGENVGKNVGKNERQKIILAKIKKGVFNQRNFALEIGVNAKTIERDIKQLKDKIKFIGSKKGGKWILRKNNPNP